MKILSHFHLKIPLFSVLVALFVVPLATLSASPQDKNAASANAPEVRATLPTIEEAAEAALAASKEKAASEAARFAPAAAPAAIPRPARPAAPNGTATIIVTATAGTMGPTVYFDLSDAFAAINAGTHQGNITVSVVGNCIEPGPAVLNSNGAGSASYTSVLIRPTVDAVTISGATATGRGLIELNGADNVTIDGDNPNSAGTNRNLTIQNTAANTVTFTSVVRIALAATVVTSADNDTVKNCNIIGSSPGRNVATAISTGGTENTTFGFFAGPGASTVSATTAPSALTSVSTGVGSPATAANLVVSNNNFSGSMARAINANGSATSVFPGLQIANNVIGNATAGSVDQVTGVGITAQGSTNASISGNTVYVEGFIPSSSATHGINVGVNSTAVSGATIEKNKVSRVRNNNGQSWSAFGINLGGGNNHVVRNNFVFDVRNDQTAGTGAFGSTFGAYGIRIASGTGHKIYHNSVNLFGVLPGATSTDITAAFLMTATSQTGCDVRNNIFSNIMTGGNPTSPNTRHVAIFLPSGGTSAMNLTLNNNDYVEGTDPNSRMAQVGTTAGTGEYTAANFDPTMTTPSTNFRSYSSTLSAAGTNDDSSKKVDPQFVSNTDLHITGTSPMIDMGASGLGVSDDIDGNARSTPPDIGAHEFGGAPPPANDIAAIAFITPANGGSVSTGTSITPQASFKNVGTATQTNVGVRFTITGPGGYNYVDNEVIATINTNQTVTVTFAPAPTFTAAGAYSMEARVTTPDANAANDVITGGFTALAPLSGTYNVPGDYPSLTNAGGIFAALNAAGASGNITINITGDLTAEAGTNALNGLTGGFSVLIRPTGAARTISGSFGGALLRFVGANNVTIDGALAGPIINRPDASLRNLTIINTSVSSPSVVSFGSVGTTPITNDALRNCVVRNGVNTSSAVVISDATTLGNPGFFSNITIRNNNVQKAFIGVYANGGTTPQGGANLFYQDNDLTTTGANAIRFIGLYMQGVNGASVLDNDVGNFDGTSDEDDRGIWFASGTINAIADANAVFGLKYTGINGYGAHGIVVSTGVTGANVQLSNNMIYNLSGDGFNYTSIFGDNPFGIYAFGTQTGVNIYFNSINLSGNTLNQTSAISAGISLGTGTVADVRDNAVVNNLGLMGATGYGSIGILLQTAASQLAAADYNDYFVNPTGSGVKAVGQIGTTASTTIANWRTATGKETNSISVDPLFISATNLHLGCGSPLAGAGTTIAAVTNDFDLDTRSSPPSIGADEPVVTLLSAVSSKVHGGAGTFNINLPLVGAPGIESRSTGGNHTIVFTFGVPVTVGSATVTSGTGVAGAPTGNGTNTITVNLTGVTNAQYVTVTLNCVDNGTNIGTVSVTMGVLAGDVTANGSVNGTDVNTVKLQSGNPVGAGNFRSDVNANGSITGTDVNAVKLGSGTALPP